MVARAPVHAGENVRLDSRPDTDLAANAADSLLQGRWATAWEHGYYRRKINLKADPRPPKLELASRVSDVDGTSMDRDPTGACVAAGGVSVSDVASRGQRMDTDGASTSTSYETAPPAAAPPTRTVSEP